MAVVQDGVCLDAVCEGEISRDEVHRLLVAGLLGALIAAGFDPASLNRFLRRFRPASTKTPPTELFLDAATLYAVSSRTRSIRSGTSGIPALRITFS